MGKGLKIISLTTVAVLEFAKLLQWAMAIGYLPSQQQPTFSAPREVEISALAFLDLARRSDVVCVLKDRQNKTKWQWYMRFFTNLLGFACHVMLFVAFSNKYYIYISIYMVQRSNPPLPPWSWSPPHPPCGVVWASSIS